MVILCYFNAYRHAFPRYEGMTEILPPMLFEYPWKQRLVVRWSCADPHIAYRDYLRNGGDLNFSYWLLYQPVF